MTATEVLRNEVRNYINGADEKLLKKVQAIFEEVDEDMEIDSLPGENWEDLPGQLKLNIEAAIKEGEDGRGIPHSEILKKYSKWFGK
jgi:hypothetical protein